MKRKLESTKKPKWKFEMNFLENKYKKEIIEKLNKKFGYKSVMAVPKITKVTLNMGVGKAVTDKKILTSAIADMTLISGQKPQTTFVAKSIAGFKIREGWPIGCKVTLRKKRMYEFLQRLIDIALPRVRDFRGLNNKGFDGMGNYSFGLKEQIVFSEIAYDKIDEIRGLDISITTTAKTNDEAEYLLRSFNLPLRKNN
jgi:large subunit ribosomal protein L5